MSDEVAVILDTTALQAYVDGQVAVGELMAEVADEGRQVAVPAACLAAAHAATTSDVGTALLALLMTAPVVRLLPLGADEAREAGRIARAAAGDIALGHGAHAALVHETHYATTQPKLAAAALPVGWNVLDLSEG